MRATKEMNKNKGITLIALVITIIVMLILVAVTISMAVNGGLFGYAGKAVGDTNNAMLAEGQLGSGRIQVGGVWYDSIDEYIAGIQSENQSGGTTGGEENNTPIESGISITPTEIILKKKETGAVGEEVLTGTITASVFGMESEPEITWEKSSDAITLSSTTGKTVTVTAAGTENTEITVTAKCTYEGQEYTATSKVTLEIIEKEEPEEGGTAATVQSKLASYLGHTVNYGVTYTDASSYGNGEWEIFYADGEHIYLITKGYLAGGTVTISGYNGTADFTADNLATKYPAIAQGLLDKTYDPTAAGTDEDPFLKYSSSYDNMKVTQYLLDSTVWAVYAPNTNQFAEWAIGGPTLELFVRSYNASSFCSSPVTLRVQAVSEGYLPVLDSNYSIPSGSYLSMGDADSSCNFRLAAPSYNGPNYIYKVQAYGNHVAETRATGNIMNFRPVVCLNSKTRISWNETTSRYDLSLVSAN